MTLISLFVVFLLVIGISYSRMYMHWQDDFFALLQHLEVLERPPLYPLPNSPCFEFTTAAFRPFPSLRMGLQQNGCRRARRWYQLSHGHAQSRTINFRVSSNWLNASRCPSPRSHNPLRIPHAPFPCWSVRVPIPRSTDAVLGNARARGNRRVRWRRARQGNRWTHGGRLEGSCAWCS